MANLSDSIFKLADIIRTQNENEFIEKNVKLLAKYINFYVNKTQNINIFTLLINEYMKNNNIAITLDSQIECNDNAFEILIQLKKCMSQKIYNDFVNDCLLFIPDLFEDENNFFNIPHKFANILHIKAQNAIVTFNVENLNFSVHISKMFEIIDSDKTFKDILLKIAPHIYYKAFSIYKHNKNFINHIKKQNKIIDFSKYTKNKDIVKFAKILNGFLRHQEKEDIEQYLPDNFKPVVPIIKQLQSNFIQTRNMILASFVLNQCIYNIDILEFCLLQLDNYS